MGFKARKKMELTKVELRNVLGETAFIASIKKTALLPEVVIFECVTYVRAQELDGSRAFNRDGLPIYCESSSTKAVGVWT